MTILMIIFAPPLYFLTRKKWGGFVFNFALYILALLTVLVFGIGVFFWMIAVVHAAWTYRTEAMQEQATILAKAIVSEQKKQ